MAATISAIADGLKVRLATITGVSATASQPAAINNPSLAFPVLQGVTFNGAMGGGLVTSRWVIVVIVGRWDDKRAYTKLDGFLSYSGATSVRAALEGDKTLGGVVETLVLPTGASIVPQSQGDAEFLRVQFDCTVYG